jgi:hypothetical protein
MKIKGNLMKIYIEGDEVWGEGKSNGNLRIYRYTFQNES